jgi:acyl carrier protein
MTISSRTPEGEPARCPLCDANIAIEPSVFFGDGTCPNCGELIWFLKAPDDTRTFSRHGNEELRDRILDSMAEQLGIPRERIANNPSLLSDIGADSLDSVELLMELEEEFNIFDD